MNTKDSNSAKPMRIFTTNVTISDSDLGEPAIDAVEPVTSISAGTKLTVSAAKLKPFLEHHGLSTSKDTLTVEVLRMGVGTTDINPKKLNFLVVEIKLVDNQDPALDGKVMNVSFGDLVTIK
jgi:hypothetical protein